MLQSLPDGADYCLALCFSGSAVVHNGVLDHDVRFIAKPFTLEQLAAKLRDALAIS